MAMQDGHRLGGVDAHPSAPPPAHATQQSSNDFHATGDKIEIDFAEADQALKHLDEAYNRLDSALQKFESVTWILNPGWESASTSFVDSANDVRRSKRDEIDNHRATVEAMRQNLHTHLDSYRLTEQTNADNHQRAGE